MQLPSNIYNLFLCLFTAGKSECCDLFLNGRCYQKSNKQLTWYDARKNCSDDGGDLASFETLSDTNNHISQTNLTLITNWDYWIGLQKSEWRWEDTGLPVNLSLCHRFWLAVRLFSRCFCLSLCVCLSSSHSFPLCSRLFSHCDRFDR